MRILLCLSAIIIASAQGPPAAGKPSEGTRRDRVMGLVVKATPEACAALAEALTDESYDIRRRAASALYGRCDRSAAAGFVDRLCRSLELGNPDAGAVLLLGYGKPEDALPCLRRIAAAKEMVKLTLGSKPVPIALPAQVAMARLGDRDALAHLRESFEKPYLPAALFLLGVLRDIDDHDALKAALKLLDDDRQAPGVAAHGSRQVRDVCLEALIARLSLRPSFQVRPGRRYSPSEIAEVRSAAERALSQ